jgi:hypothetical protein
VCFAYVPSEKRTKLEDFGVKCRLLGYGDDMETEVVNGYTDQSDDDFFSADEDPAILGSHLMNQMWWKGTHTLEYAMLAVTKGTPVSYKDAIASDEAHYWKEAMDSEMKSIRDNVTYKLDVPPVGKKQIGSRWGFRKNFKPDGTIDRYKARLVAKGFKQKKGQEYNETFAAVAKYKSIRMLLAIAAHSGWKVYHDDAKMPF